jgi:hypothetical protein
LRFASAFSGFASASLATVRRSGAAKPLRGLDFGMGADGADGRAPSGRSRHCNHANFAGPSVYRWHHAFAAEPIECPEQHAIEPARRGRFPVTLYKEQWILDMSDEIPARGPVAAVIRSGRTTSVSNIYRYAGQCTRFYSVAEWISRRCATLTQDCSF